MTCFDKLTEYIGNFSINISDVSDLIIAAAATATAMAAIYGISSWKRELAGKATFDTARSFIRSTYRLRDEIHSCRSPIISASEFPEGYTPTDATDQESAEAWRHVYSTRWKYVQEAIREFQAQRLEAEALWGSELKSISENLSRCVSRLFAAIESFIADKESGGENFRSNDAFKTAVLADLNSTNIDNNDELTTNIRSAIEQIESYIRPHLDRK